MFPIISISSSIVLVIVYASLMLFLEVHKTFNLFLLAVRNSAEHLGSICWTHYSAPTVSWEFRLWSWGANRYEILLTPCVSLGRRKGNHLYLRCPNLCSVNCVARHQAPQGYLAPQLPSLLSFATILHIHCFAWEAPKE